MECLDKGATSLPEWPTESLTFRPGQRSFAARQSFGGKVWFLKAETAKQKAGC